MLPFVLIQLLLCMSWTPDIELSDPIHLADMFTLLRGAEYLHNTPLVILSSSMWKRSMQCQWLYRAPFLIYFFSNHPSWSQIISCLKNSIFLNCQKLKSHDPVWSSGTHILFPWSLYMNNQQTTSLLKIGLDFMQSHPLHRTCFRQHKASLAVLGWLEMEMETAISCTECSQMPGVIHKFSINMQTESVGGTVL